MVKGQYSKVFIKTPDITFVGKIMPAPLEYWYATTVPDDIALYNKAVKENPGKSMHEVLLELAAKYPAGAYKEG